MVARGPFEDLTSMPTPRRRWEARRGVAGVSCVALGALVCAPLEDTRFEALAGYVALFGFSWVAARMHGAHRLLVRLATTPTTDPDHRAEQIEGLAREARFDPRLQACLTAVLARAELRRDPVRAARLFAGLNARGWTAERIARGWCASSADVADAAALMAVFDALGGNPRGASRVLARVERGRPRPTTVLLRAVLALLRDEPAAAARLLRRHVRARAPRRSEAAALSLLLDWARFRVGSDPYRTADGVSEPCPWLTERWPALAAYTERGAG